jgi:hypothetical protein
LPFRYLASLLAVLLLPLAAQAQTEDSQLWLAANAQIGVAKNERLALESIGRFSDRAGGFFHSEFGAIGAIDAAKGVELAIGFRHVQDWNHHIALANEERVREQVSFTLAKGFVTRLRFEQRFHSSGGAIGVRLRPQFRFTLPLRPGGLALLATHESFLNFNTTGWGQRAGYERIRNAVAFSIPLAHNLKVDVGYLNQYRFGRGGARDTMDHAATTSLTINL